MMKNDRKGCLILPNFLIVGTMKAGTTSLFDILNQHSQIYLPPQKELHFFDHDDQVNKGLEFYAQYFKDAGNAKAIGEASPSYLFYPEVAARIYTMLGEKMRIIVLLRNPAERAFSHYKMMLANGFEKRSFTEAITTNLQSLQKGINFDRVTSYLDRGFYASQLRNYNQFFPKENIKIVLFEEDFAENRKRTIRQIQKFLGVDYEDVVVSIKTMPTAKMRSANFDRVLNTAHPVNQFFKKMIPSKKVRKWIKYWLNEANNSELIPRDELEALKPKLINEVFYDDILETEKLIGRDLSRWC
ncbi:MAG: sulfotransferase [Sphingobacteriia bacterium]|nr:sulfotransferase [Sphingobacteriia bacterium]